MKKLKFLAISTVVSVGLIAGCSSIGKAIEEALKIKPDYYTQNQTTALIEKHYAQKGKFAVTSQVFPSNHESFQTFKIWYPTDLENNNKRYPVIVSANGTGFPYQKYEPVLERLASWGFVVIGNDDPTTWNGLSSSLSLDQLNALNADKNSVFFGKLNTQNAGIVGHSQGGFSVVNAITVQPHHEQFKSAVILSSTAQTITFLKWTADATKIRIPTLILGSTGKVDESLAPLPILQTLYSQIPNTTAKVLARRKEADHGDMLYKGDGYVTAWFMWKLQNDNRAAQAFTGAKAEILHNPLYTDVKIQ